MDSRDLEGKIFALNYSFGPWFCESETGGENHLTFWRFTQGKFSSVHHQGEPYEFDWEKAVDFAKRQGVTIYTPSYTLFIEDREFDYFRYKGSHEHFDEGEIIDWIEYEPLCTDDYGWYRLRSEGIEVTIFDRK